MLVIELTRGFKLAGAGGNDTTSRVWHRQYRLCRCRGFALANQHTEKRTLPWRNALQSPGRGWRCGRGTAL